MDLLIRYAFSFVGVPYVYGGNNPISGLDCSGYVCEVLRFGGVIGNKEDLGAQGLYDRLERDSSFGLRGPGCLAFFGKSLTEITHVAFMVDTFRIIEAGGGDSTTTSVEEAKKRSAFVRGRLLTYRGDLVGTLKPKYSAIGIV